MPLRFRQRFTEPNQFLGWDFFMSPQVRSGFWAKIPTGIPTRMDRDRIGKSPGHKNPDDNPDGIPTRDYRENTW